MFFCEFLSVNSFSTKCFSGKQFSANCFLQNDFLRMICNSFVSGSKIKGQNNIGLERVQSSKIASGQQRSKSKENLIKYGRPELLASPWQGRVGRRSTTGDLKELIALLNDKIKKTQELFEIFLLVHLRLISRFMRIIYAFQQWNVILVLFLNTHG